MYKNIIAQTKNPEFISALATIYEMDNNPEAGLLYVQADSLFRKQYQLFPKAVVGHFVESLLQRKQIDPELLRFAMHNYQWRPNAQSKYLLAKVYLRLG